MDHGLEEDAVAILDKLPHAMQVRGEIHGSREDTFQVFSLGLSVKLLPPLAQILEFGVVGDQDFDFLSHLAIKEVAHGRILDGRVFRGTLGKDLLHLGGTGKHGTRVETRYDNGQQAHRREHRETAAHVVRNHEGPVTFLGGQGLQGTFLGIRNGHDALGSILVFLFDVFFDNPEGYGRFGRGAGLGDDDAGDVALCHQIHQLGQVFLRQVVAGENHLGIRFLAAQLTGKIMGQGLNGATGAQIRTADADHDHQVHALGLPAVTHGFAVCDQGFGRLAGKMFPSQEIISGAIPGNQRIKCGKGFPDRFIVLRILHEGAAASKIYFYHIHSINFLAFAKVLFFAVKSYILFIFVNYE